MLITFLRRVAGAALLDPGTYEDIEADRTATPQAIAVVLLSSLAAGIGLNGARGATAALTFFALTSGLALGTWALFALITLQAGSRLLPSPQTDVDLGELLRTLGFAAAPGLLQVFALVSPAPILTAAFAFAWTTGMAWADRSSGGPIPERCSSTGDAIAPAATITSRRARASNARPPLSSR